MPTHQKLFQLGPLDADEARVLADALDRHVRALLGPNGALCDTRAPAAARQAFLLGEAIRYRLALEGADRPGPRETPAVVQYAPGVRRAWLSEYRPGRRVGERAD